ncbi:GxxExxY protein [Haloferula sp.]|uniref:GxxExxY protein n=1 Tax=Haloferula sp. TaxID=2497595 RepID=UPI003C70BD27
MELLLKEETHAILGACFEVYREKGCGFVEDVFQECLEIEFGILGLPMVAQPGLEAQYKGRTLRKRFVPDFICYDQVILEIKAVKTIDDIHRAQVMNYLKATGKRVGLLVNFGHHPKAQFERFVL